MEAPAPSSSPATKKRKTRRSAISKTVSQNGSEQTLLEISDGEFLNRFAALLADQVMAARQEQEQLLSADRPEPLFSGERFDSSCDS